MAKTLGIHSHAYILQTPRDDLSGHQSLIMHILDPGIMSIQSLLVQTFNVSPRSLEAGAEAHVPAIRASNRSGRGPESIALVPVDQ